MADGRDLERKGAERSGHTTLWFGDLGHDVTLGVNQVDDQIG